MTAPNAPQKPTRLFLIDTCHGVTVSEHCTLREARRHGVRKYGTHGFNSAKAATMDDLVEVKRAGGWIPFDWRDAVEDHERATVAPSPPRAHRPKGKRGAA